MRVLLLTSLLCLSACATPRGDTAMLGPGALPATDPVAVSWQDPARFDEVRYNRGLSFTQRDATQWLPPLAEHLRESASKRLGPGQTLDIEILNVDLAGEYEPWRGANTQEVRVMRDIYAPRMTLQFTWRDPTGDVIASGERKITDLDFLLGSRPLDSDRLRFEKRMIDNWTRREFTRELAAR